MKAILNQLGFYLFFVLLALLCAIWGIRATQNPDASTGETLTFFAFVLVWIALAVVTYRYEKKHNLNQ